VSNITINRETGRTLTITKIGRPPIAISKPIRTVAVTKVGARGPAGDITQDPGDIAAVFLSA